MVSRASSNVLGGARPPSARSARRRAWRLRRAERGAALFIVVLVILSLTGVALFAARSATMDVTIAGRFKQSGQTRHIARLGMEASLHELARDPATYMRGMKDNTMFGAGSTGNACVYEVKQDSGGAQMDTGGCFRFAYGGIQYAMKTDLNNSSTFQLMDPGDVTNEKPGSIGYADIRPNFAIEMTDKVELPWPVPGYQGGQGSNMRFYSVTMTGTGETVPRSGVGADPWSDLVVTPAKAFMASVEETRAQVVIGPLPQGI